MPLRFIEGWNAALAAYGDAPYLTQPGLALHGSEAADLVRRYTAAVIAHGLRPGAPVADRYRYLYDGAQLDEWAPRIAAIAEQAAATRVVFNNCYGNYGTTNAAELTARLAEPG